MAKFDGSMMQVVAAEMKPAMAALGWDVRDDWTSRVDVDNQIVLTGPYYRDDVIAFATANRQDFAAAGCGIEGARALAVHRATVVDSKVRANDGQEAA